jgi:hypothetical protein
VFFTPSALAVTSARFEAVVESGTDARTNTLAFDVRGEGTLPRVSVLKPDARNDAGKPVIKFGRTLVGKAESAAVTIQNDGLITAFVRFDSVSGGGGSFAFSGRGAQLELAPGESKSFEANFRCVFDCHLKSCLTLQAGGTRRICGRVENVCPSEPV